MEELDLHPIPEADEIKENLLPDIKPSRVFTNSVKITSGGKLKALFLKSHDSPIAERHYKPALNALRKIYLDSGFNPAEKSGRPMVKQTRIGCDLTRDGYRVAQVEKIISAQATENICSRRFSLIH